MQGEDCIRLDRANLTVRREGKQYLLTDGRSRMMMFPNAGEAHRTRDLIVQNGFERRCYRQRPNPKSTYFPR